MFTRDQIIALGQENQKTIAAAVRIMAALQSRGTPIAQAEVPKIASITTLVFEEIKPALARYFTLRAGRFHLLDPLTAPAPWDTDDNSDRVNKALESLRRQAVEQNDLSSPRGLLIHAIQTVLKSDYDAAKKLYFFLTRTYSPERVEAAVASASERQPPPHDPKSFIIAILRNGGPIGTAGPRKTGPAPTRAFKFIRPANAEHATSQRLGWEAATQTSPDGSPVWEKGHRRLVFRMRDGYAQFVDPPSHEIPPSIEADPGVLLT